MKKFYIIVFMLLTFGLSQAQIVNIPDPDFKYTLVNYNCVDTNGDGIGDVDADTNNDGEIQQAEAESVIGLNVSYKAIHSLEGIQSFINLEYLNCEVNQLTALNLSQNPNLVILNCHFNNITNLVISQSPNLIELNCAINELSNLDVSQNTNLERLWCSYNQIADLNLTQNTKIKTLACVSNHLTSLDVTNNADLEFFNCESNQLTNLELLNPNLERLQHITRRQFLKTSGQFSLGAIALHPALGRGRNIIALPGVKAFQSVLKLLARAAASGSRCFSRSLCACFSATFWYSALMSAM